MPKKNVFSIKDELIRKGREAVLAAVQVYNNPNITFKAETFITLAVIGWTYLLHAYYRSQKLITDIISSYSKERNMTVQSMERISIGS